MNWLACALGGAGSPDADRLIQALKTFGQGDAKLVGRSENLILQMLH
jgi:hypothetical protein